VARDHSCNRSSVRLWLRLVYANLRKNLGTDSRLRSALKRKAVRDDEKDGTIAYSSDRWNDRHEYRLVALYKKLRSGLARVWNRGLCLARLYSPNASGRSHLWWNAPKMGRDQDRHHGLRRSRLHDDRRHRLSLHALEHRRNRCQLYATRVLTLITSLGQHRYPQRRGYFCKKPLWLCHPIVIEQF